MSLGQRGIHRHTAVIAHTGMGPGGIIEERRFAAVGIAHQRHVQVATLLQGLAAQIALGNDLGLRSIATTHFQLSGLGRRHHLYHGRLMVPQRHLVAHNLVLHRVLQRGIQQYLHLLSLDEAHLNDALAEASVSCHLDNDPLLACL